MNFYQNEIIIREKKRGYHLITAEIIGSMPIISQINIGILNIFIKHTSASITVNENTDPDVRYDFEKSVNRLFPDNPQLYTHTDEGPDDMPAHLKSSVFGCSLNIPITRGQLNMGIWQGIYLCEHRNYGGNRKLVLTVWGT